MNWANVHYVVLRYLGGKAIKFKKKKWSARIYYYIIYIYIQLVYF